MLRFLGELSTRAHAPASTIGVPRAVLHEAEQATDTLPQELAAPEKSRAAEIGQVAAAGGGNTTGGGGDS